MKDLAKDFSGVRSIRWRLWLLVLVLHAVVIAGLNTVLAINRLAAQAEASFDVAILPNEAPPSNAKSAKSEPSKPETPEPSEPSVKADVPPEPSAPIATALPAPIPPIAMPEAMGPATTVLTANRALQGLRATPPAPVLLRYVLTKGNDSARASLSWKPVLAEKTYETIFEATYFGLSILKQTSTGIVDTHGLLPMRFAEKRRGKSEQATHFEREKSLVTFSNNHPEAKLTLGAQDRASFLIQLAGLYAENSEAFQAGRVIELPVASVDELELWTFDIHASESMQLPIGQIDAIKLMRRPRRSFDAAVEVWLAPKYDYLPVRIRQTDAGGVTDSQLVSKE